MQSRIASLLSTLAATVFGAVVAVVIMLGTTNGSFTALYDGLLKEFGLATGTMTITSGSSYQTGTSTGMPTGSSSGTTTTSAVTGSVTANWAGYVATGVSYTAIHGTWTVPNVSTSGNDSADATWIGIGGSGSSDLIQIGTENIVENGQVELEPFYEELPDYASTITTMDVSAGDSITASITETTAGVWTLSLDDATNGQSFSKTVDYDSTNSSAEWIEEAPSTNAGIIALDQFGSVSFSDATVTAGGISESLSASGAAAITMENGYGQALTDVGTVNASGDGFTVTRTAASSTGGSGENRIRRHEPGANRFGGSSY